MSGRFLSAVPYPPGGQKTASGRVCGRSVASHRRLANLVFGGNVPVVVLVSDLACSVDGHVERVGMALLQQSVGGLSVHDEDFLSPTHLACRHSDVVAKLPQRRLYSLDGLPMGLFAQIRCQRGDQIVLGEKGEPHTCKAATSVQSQNTLWAAARRLTQDIY